MSVVKRWLARRRTRLDQRAAAHRLRATSFGGSGNASVQTSHRRPGKPAGRSIARKVNAQLGLLCDIGVGVSFIAFGQHRHVLGPVSSLTLVLIGLALFTLVEYMVHRWLFHGPPSALKVGHWQHHVEPLGDDALPFFLPPLAALLLARALSTLISGGAAALFVGGMALGYACYGLSHATMHRVRFARALPRRWAAPHHIHHHHPETNFGVTTPLWDIVFRTRYIAQRDRSLATRT
jgi:sterol desaturase/sphingolipid hydroxylase (fatty acid hydroxylase superfamily)